MATKCNCGVRSIDPNAHNGNCPVSQDQYKVPEVKCTCGSKSFEPKMHDADCPVSGYSS